jgi:hypothetical protein
LLISAAESDTKRFIFDSPELIHVNCSLADQLIFVKNERHRGSRAKCLTRNDKFIRQACLNLKKTCLVNLADVVESTKSIYSDCTLKTFDFHYTCSNY